MTRPRRRGALALGVAVLILLLVGGRWAALETAERAWAATIPGGAAYVMARGFARLVSGLILVAAVTWGTGNLFFVYRAIGSVQLPRRLGDLEIVEAVPQSVLRAGTLASGVILGVILALGTGDWWMSALLASAPPRFGVTDPVLHRDLGYYLGQLPWAVRAQGLALLAAATATVIVALLYLGIGSLRFRRWRPAASPHARFHLGLLLASTALAMTWGAVLDPAEVVAGLHGALDAGALGVRVPGAPFVSVLAVAASLASLVWALRDKAVLLVATWGTLLAGVFLVYLAAPALARGRATTDTDFADQRAGLERLAFGAEIARDRTPLPLPTADAAVATIPVWDPDRVAAAARRRPDLLGTHAAVAGVTLSSHGATGAGATWLVATKPDLDALARVQPVPTWSEIHRGPWARVGRPAAATESDSALVLASLALADSAAWFGPGFGEFAVAPPDSWPATRGGGVPLTGWLRRTALAWSLQSLELGRAETEGLVLLWRRDVGDRLARLAPFATFDVPVPIVADGALWWIAYGYLAAETFPLVRPLDWHGRQVRYLRAALVGAVEAASGDTRLALAPGADALATAWARAFEPLVRPFDSLPAGVRAALPYPRETFRVAAGLVARPAGDTTAWTPRPREPFELAVPGTADARAGSGDADRVWIAQGFEAGNPKQLVAVVAGAVTPGGLELRVWRPVPVRLPSELVGAPEPRTAPGTLRLWNVAGSVFSEQALFREPAGGPGAATGIDTLYLTWGERSGQGPTPAAALRQLLTAGRAGLPVDTSLAGRWAEARRVAALADAALAAGDLEAFGRLYKRLKELLAAAPMPR